MVEGLHRIAPSRIFAMVRPKTMAAKADEAERDADIAAEAAGVHFVGLRDRHGFRPPKGRSRRSAASPEARRNAGKDSIRARSLKRRFSAA
jgi:hypothetical protein